MDLEMLRNYCMKKKGTLEAFPFDNETLVFKVGSKMFALTNINKKPLQINLKCDPYTAEELRSEYPSVKPGYHMNKRHWNTVIVDGTLDDGRICWMVDMSYRLVLSGLKKYERELILKDSQEES